MFNFFEELIFLNVKIVEIKKLKVARLCDAAYAVVPGHAFERESAARVRLLRPLSCPLMLAHVHR